MSSALRSTDRERDLRPSRWPPCERDLPASCSLRASWSAFRTRSSDLPRPGSANWLLPRAAGERRCAPGGDLLRPRCGAIRPGAVCSGQRSRIPLCAMPSPSRGTGTFNARASPPILYGSPGGGSAPERSNSRGSAMVRPSEAASSPALPMSRGGGKIAGRDGSGPACCAEIRVKASR